MKFILRAGTLLLIFATASFGAAPFTDDFSSYARGGCLTDGAAFGPWSVPFAGYGCVQIGTDGAKDWLEEKPTASASLAETHAALATGPAFANPLTFTLDVNTAAQLRRNDPPNPWEVAWVLWDYSDNNHFYYVQLKPNGWELGKEDPAYPGAQRFLATGSSPAFPIGGWHSLKIVASDQNAMSIYVDGSLLTTYTDAERPYVFGRIGLYNEDADVRFENVVLNSGPAGDGPVVPAAAAAAVRAPQKFLSPASGDGVADTAVFGAGAREVSVYNLRGRLVFHQAQQGGSPIVWDCRDGGGRIDPSGVYIARIRTAGSDTVYQSFALVK